MAFRLTVMPRAGAKLARMPKNRALAEEARKLLASLEQADKLPGPDDFPSMMPPVVHCHARRAEFMLLWALFHVQGHTCTILDFAEREPHDQRNRGL